MLRPVSESTIARIQLRIGVNPSRGQIVAVLAAQVNRVEVEHTLLKPPARFHVKV